VANRPLGLEETIVQSTGLSLVAQIAKENGWSRLKPAPAFSFYYFLEPGFY